MLELLIREQQVRHLCWNVTQITTIEISKCVTINLILKFFPNVIIMISFKYLQSIGGEKNKSSRDS
jgi:hypothetical protein